MIYLNRIKLILLSLLLPILNLCSDSYSDLQLKQINGYNSYLLSKMHYLGKDINDDFSNKVLKEYIKTLDYNKKYFTQTDIESLKKHEDYLDDYYLASDINFFDKVSTMLNEKIKFVDDNLDSILDKGFDFSIEEYYETDYEKTKYAQNNEELLAKWKKILKHQVEWRYIELIDTNNADSTKTELAYLEDEKINSEMMEKAVSKIKKRYHKLFERISTRDKIDNFSLYLNSFSKVFDPHTSYMTPRIKEDFDIDIKGKLQGIGATLSEKNGYIEITSIVPGSPSAKSDELEVKDKILKVQSEGKNIIDLVDMPLREAVTHIRGKKGTKVFLTIKKPSNVIKRIELIRDIIIIEESYAKAAIIENEDKKIAYIRLPSFYRDFSAYDGGRHCADDVERIVNEIADEDILGLVIDLRMNGGGALPDAIDMAGLFIEEGPIVQVKNREQRVKIYSDEDERIHFKKPLIVLTNQFSASASEIFSGAMKDYERAIIIGSNSTFGKGTVQNLLPLERLSSKFFKNQKPGHIKFTIQQYYRINGHSTQFEGIPSDIVVPSSFDIIEAGEREYDNAIPFDEIEIAEHSDYTSNGYDKEKIIEASVKRIEENEIFNYIIENNKKYKKKRENTNFNLDISKMIIRHKESEDDSDKLDKFKKENKDLKISKIDYFPVEKNEEKTLEDREKRKKDWFKQIRKDQVIQEAFNILNDIDNS